MVQSMTGFGKAIAEFNDKKITIEIKSLNSKQLDLNVRLPVIYREKEMDIRSELLQRLERGKVDLSVYVENIGKQSSTQINQNAVESYYRQITGIANNLNITLPEDWFSVLLRLPESIKMEVSELDESEWKIVSDTLQLALGKLLDFRKQEGAMLRSLFTEKITNITNLLSDIDVYENERIEKIREKLQESLQKLENISYDQNRFEQELIYYIEKLDINEEKHRLANHLRYFTDTMDKEKSQGKKLGFIIQEIGREINTLGSKSNHVEMQKIVVKMKDELEQIKEQVLNVL